MGLKPRQSRNVLGPLVREWMVLIETYTMRDIFNRFDGVYEQWFDNDDPV